MREVAKEALSTLSSKGKNVVELRIPTFDELFSEDVGQDSLFAAEVVLPTSFDINEPATIFHSSGQCMR